MILAFSLAFFITPTTLYLYNARTNNIAIYTMTNIMQLDRGIQLKYTSSPLSYGINIAKYEGGALFLLRSFPFINCYISFCDFGLGGEIGYLTKYDLWSSVSYSYKMALAYIAPLISASIDVIIFKLELQISPFNFFTLNVYKSEKGSYNYKHINRIDGMLLYIKPRLSLGIKLYL